MKTSAIVVICLLALSGCLILAPIPQAHATSPVVNYTNQTGVAPFSSGNTVVNIQIQTTSSTQIVLIWAAPAQVSGTTFVSDNQSNAWTAVGVAQGPCLDFGGICSYGALISNQVVDVGHDSITMLFPSNGYYLGVGAYDVSGGTVIFNVESYGNAPHSNLAVSSYSAGTSVLVLTEAYIQANTGTIIAGGSYTLAANQAQFPSGGYWASSEYEILTGSTTSPETSTANTGWFEASMSFEVTTPVSQSINILTANYAPVLKFPVTGCGVSNATFLGDGYAHTYHNLAPSSAIVVTVPTITYQNYNQYCFKDGALENCATTATVTTPSVGTGTYTNTSYYTLRNIFVMKPIPAWDGFYVKSLTGTRTYLGTVETLGTFYLSAGGPAVSIPVWSDYNVVANMTGMFAAVSAGGTWYPVGPTGFVPLTYSNTYTTSYALTGVSTNTTTHTAIGWNVPDATHLNYGLIPIVFPLFLGVIFAMVPIMFNRRGDFIVTLFLFGLVAGGAMGLLASGLVPIVQEALFVVILAIWFWAGGDEARDLSQIREVGAIG